MGGGAAGRGLKRLEHAQCGARDRPGGDVVSVRCIRVPPRPPRTRRALRGRRLDSRHLPLRGRAAPSLSAACALSKRQTLGLSGTADEQLPRRAGVVLVPLAASSARPGLAPHGFPA